MKMNYFYILLMTFAGLSWPSSTWAIDFTVDRIDDTPSASQCHDEVPDDCSLRGAILKAREHFGEAVTIHVPAGLYMLSVPGDCFLKTSQSGNHFVQGTSALCLAGEITLKGAGADQTIIDGNLADRVILVSHEGPTEIYGMTIRRGQWDSGSLYGGGGGINNAGILRIVDSVVSDNVSSNGGGGGIYNSNTLTVLRTNIVRNFTIVGSGGGIANHGFHQQAAATLIDSIVSDNSAGEHGGGVSNYLGRLSVIGSTFSGNIATATGGGLHVGGGNFAGEAVLTNTTISGNRARHGAGISDTGSSLLAPDLTVLNNVTIAKNHATEIGGGIYMAGNTAEIKLSNTIVANNNAGYRSPDCYKGSANTSLTSLGHNLIGIADTDCPLAGDNTGNLLGVDPILGILADNGGNTPTHALSNGSPAIDSGSPAQPGSHSASCAANDQRGFLRPVGDRCDIGAFERTGQFGLSRIKPSAGGNTGSVSAVVSGNGFVPGSLVKLTRAGETDVVAPQAVVDAGGSAISARFDLSGRALGSWNVEVILPDETVAVLENGFIIEAEHKAALWVDIVGRTHRPGRLTQLSVIYGNPGNVDAIGVPLSIVVPNNYKTTLKTPTTPPPAQPGQMRTDWTNVPLAVTTGGTSVETARLLSAPFLIPVVPAGFTGILRMGVTLPLDAEDSYVLAGLGEPVASPTMEDIAAAVDNARVYAEDILGVTVPADLIDELESYAQGQWDAMVTNARETFLASIGTQNQIYSLARNQIDLAFFGAGQALGWMETAESGGLLQLLTSFLDRAAQRLVWPGIRLAMAGSQNCPPVTKGGVLTPGCSGGPGPDEDFMPPEIPPPPGCIKADPTTWGKCKPTPDNCEALGTHHVVSTPDGDLCTPKRRPPHCPAVPIPNPTGAGNTDCMTFPLRPKSSVDPNDKVGPQGATELQLLSDPKSMTYTIFFENLPAATAPAQEVLIEDQLDTSVFDLDNFSLGPITFGDWAVTPAPGMHEYTGSIDLRPELNEIVAITAKLDRKTGVLTWRLFSLDPITGKFTDDPDAGFLPPNVTSPEGEGSVLFTVGLKSGIQIGTDICNGASIIFDVNEPIETPFWCNTITEQIIDVPNVVGLSQPDAVMAILGSNLTVGTVTQKPSSTAPAGVVINQAPEAGSQIEPGGKVDLVVSSGVALIIVQNVVGQSQSDAEAAILGLGLTVGTVVEQPSSTIPAGFVISQDPEAGTPIPPGGKVDLVVSSGAESFLFSGFFSPINNSPSLNKVKAGSSIPVKFKLGGNHGLDIIDSGFPASAPINCDQTQTLGENEQTITAGSSGLSFNDTSGLYTYIWKTEKKWSNTCRQLIIKFVDGTMKFAYFNFH